MAKCSRPSRAKAWGGPERLSSPRTRATATTHPQRIATAAHSGRREDSQDEIRRVKRIQSLSPRIRRKDRADAKTGNVGNSPSGPVPADCAGGATVEPVSNLSRRPSGRIPCPQNGTARRIEYGHVHPKVLFPGQTDQHSRTDELGITQGTGNIVATRARSSSRLLVGIRICASRRTANTNRRSRRRDDRFEHCRK